MYTDDLQNQSQSDSYPDNLFPEDSLKNKKAEHEARHSDNGSLRICYNSANANENISNSEIVNNNFFSGLIMSEDFFKYHADNEDAKSSSQNVISDGRLESENAELVARHFQDGHLLCMNNQIIANPDKNNKLFSADLLFMNQNFFKCLRSITRHPSIIRLPATYKCILYVILDYLAYRECLQDDHGVLINVQPGQLLTTHEELAKLANVDVNHSKRALNKFLTIKILTQEVIHRKTLVKLSEPYLSELLNKWSEPKSEPKVNQERTIKEEDKEYKEIKQRKVVAAEAAPFDVGADAPPSLSVSSFSNQKRAKKQEPKSSEDEHNVNYPTENETKKELKHKNKTKKQLPSPEKHLADGKILHGDKVFLLPIEYQKLKEKHGEQKLNEMIQILDSHKLSNNKEYSSDYGTMKEGGWVLNAWEERNAKKSPASQFKSIDQIEKNKKIAEEHSNKWKSSHYRFDICKDGVEIIGQGAGNNFFPLKYTENGFEDQLIKLLNLKGFKINKLVK